MATWVNVPLEDFDVVLSTETVETTYWGEGQYDTYYYKIHTFTLKSTSVFATPTTRPIGEAAVRFDAISSSGISVTLSSGYTLTDSETSFALKSYEINGPAPTITVNTIEFFTGYVGRVSTRLLKTSGLTIERIWVPDPPVDPPPDDPPDPPPDPDPPDPPDPPPEDPPDPPLPVTLPALPSGWYWGCYVGGTSSGLGEQLYSYFIWNYSGYRSGILFEAPYITGCPILTRP